MVRNNNLLSTGALNYKLREATLKRRKGSGVSSGHFLGRTIPQGGCGCGALSRKEVNETEMSRRTCLAIC